MIVYEIPWNILLYKRQFYVLLPRSCFSVLGQIKSIKRSLPAHTLTIVVTVLVHSRFYYCNVVFAGLPNCDIQRVKCVLNTVVRLVADASRWDPVTPLLRDHQSSSASYQAVFWVQAVHNCSSLPARRSTTLSGQPHHAVCRSDRQSRPQIRHIAIF